MKKAQKECTDKKKEIAHKISEIPCTFLEDQKAIDVDVVIK